MYTWVPVHEAISKKLLEYEQRQSDLIEILDQAEIYLPPDKDDSGDFPMEEIDPFTFYNQIYKHRSDKRLEKLNKLAELLGVDERAYDTNGVPSIMPLVARIFPYKEKRPDDFIPELWKLFRQVVTGNLEPNLFKKFLDSKSFGRARLTSMLFNANPSANLPINKQTDDAIEKLGISAHFSTLSEYLNIVKVVKQKSQKDTYAFSYEGWLANSGRAAENEEEYEQGTDGLNGNSASKSYWKFAPGKSAEKWNEFRSKGIMAVSFTGNNVGDLRNYKTLKDLEKVIGRKNSNEAGSLWTCYAAPDGDVVFANRGRNTVVGVGIIDGSYTYQENDIDFRHHRPVKWLSDKVWEYTPGSFASEKKARPALFRIDTLSRTEVGPEILTEYLKAYPEYEESFRQAGIWPVDTKNINDAAAQYVINSRVMNRPLNSILFGPPGTGKTYNSISKALECIGENIIGLNRNEIKDRYSELVTDGRVVFTTFHQSMSYEDFIEGIKPLEPVKGESLQYDIVDGIFKKVAELAESNWSASQHHNAQKLTFEAALEKLKDEWDEDPSIKFALKTVGYEFTITGFTNKSISFKKASGGEGHTLSISTLKELYYGKREVWWNGVGIYYPGILTKMNSYSASSANQKLQNYVLIIDEINRGNVSQIFGELITLIEDDKRLGQTEALTVTLPYSKEKFGVPPNLYIIGTMNTADRSVEALDTALRRRFTFVEMQPLYNLPELKVLVAGYPLSTILETINGRIEMLVDKDHLLGHSYLIGVKNTAQLKQVFANKFLPLLQEYFFGDYGKIGLVLGQGFISSDDKPKVNFAKLNGYDSAELRDKKIYRIENVSEMNDYDFEAALKTMME
jgi:5-methylcytosine-specific restriction protein B